VYPARSPRVTKEIGVGHAIKRRLALALLIVSIAAAAAAQSGAGSIAGTVKDASGGAVPGASVTVASPERGVDQTGLSNEQGTFAFPLLPPGTYTISVELQGFKKVVRSNVILPVASRVNVGDVVLEVGNVTEAVTVAANVGRLQIQTESGERSDLVTNTQLRDLALNGRNVVDLMKTIPGVIAGGTVTSSTVNNVVGGFNINGTRSLQHDYTVDGVTNLNLGNNTGALVSVNPDALEDVKVMTSNYQAEYGRSGGGVVALTTRGGTSEYHGGLRYFKRDDRLNANTFFNNARGGEDAGFPRPPYRFNYYGWDFGGPVPISKGNADRKVFFFAAQEYYDQLVPQTTSNNIRVPTAAERTGDFSQTVDGTGRAIPIIDPLTGLQFPGNRIPANRLYAPGQAVLGLFPLPNSTASATYNYTSQVPSQYPRREDIARVDWQISPNTRLSGRWVHNFDDQQFAYGTTTASWNFPLTVTDRKNGPGTTLSFTLSHIFSPTLVNEFIYGAGRGGVDIAPSDDKATRSVTGINTPLLFPDANTANLIPSLTFGGIASITTGANGGAVNTSVFGPFNQKFVIDNFIDNITKLAGKHTFKAGLYYQRASNASNSQTNVQSNIDFTATGTNPLNTGYPFANALLGVYSSYTQASAKPNGKYFYYDLSGYIQDTFKPNAKTTLDLGLRLSHYDPYYNAAGPGAYFNPALYSRLRRRACIAAPAWRCRARTTICARSIRRRPARRRLRIPSGRSSSASSCPIPATSPTAWA
jgi:hypothetical protein